MAAILNIPRDQPFDSLLLNDRLSDYTAPRDKISHMAAAGEIVRVKKGLYVPGPRMAVQGVDPLVLSGLIYGPSYVSFESAMSIHGLIPERVEETTCATTKRQKLFETPMGRFSYLPVPLASFPLGVESRSAAGGHYLLATAEKALCDRVSQSIGIKSQEQIADLLLHDLRLDETTLRQVSCEQVATIAGSYRRGPVNLLARWLPRFQKVSIS